MGQIPRSTERILVFDKKLSFLPHLQYLRQKCMKALNLLQVVASTTWDQMKKLNYICIAC